MTPLQQPTRDCVPLPPALQLGAEGKRLRPTMLLLMASSLSATAPSAAMLTVDETPHSSHPTDTRRRQQRIAEITEMIHVASLLHDDVIDSAETRRGLKALNSVMGNKVWLHAALQPFHGSPIPSHQGGWGGSWCDCVVFLHVDGATRQRAQGTPQHDGLPNDEPSHLVACGLA